MEQFKERCIFANPDTSTSDDSLVINHIQTDDLEDYLEFKVNECGYENSICLTKDSIVRLIEHLNKFI